MALLTASAVASMSAVLCPLIIPDGAGLTSFGGTLTDRRLRVVTFVLSGFGTKGARIPRELGGRSLLDVVELEAADATSPRSASTSLRAGGAIAKGAPL